MFIHYRSQGIVLKRENRGETDQLFTIYTKDFGKLEILGKAIRKTASKLRASIDIFYLSEIEFIQGKAQKTLTDAILIEDFKNLRKDLRKLRVAYKISEVLNDLVRGQEPDENIWNLLNETFEKLNNYSLRVTGYWLLYYYFLWNFLSILGYQPELHNCIHCQKELVPENLYFNAKDGGLFCPQCQRNNKSGKPIDVNVIKLIRILLQKDFDILKRLKIESNDLKSLKIISDFYLSEIL